MRSNRWHGPRGLLIAAVALVGWVGCGGGDPYQRVGVSGTVTVDGRPLASGTIGFVPTRDGPAAGGPITAGRYRIPSGKGPAAGPYRVEIRSIQPTGRKVPDHDNPGQMMDETRDVIPERFNLQSSLVAEVQPGSAQTFDYAVDTTRTPTRRNPR